MNRDENCQNMFDRWCLHDVRLMCVDAAVGYIAAEIEKFLFFAPYPTTAAPARVLVHFLRMSLYV